MLFLLVLFRMPPMPFPMPPLFITAVKDICAINTFEKLLNILFSEVYCWYFGLTTLLFSATITDMSLYELLNLFPRWPLVFRSFLLPPLVARDVVTPQCNAIGVHTPPGVFVRADCLEAKLTPDRDLSDDDVFWVPSCFEALFEFQKALFNVYFEEIVLSNPIASPWKPYLNTVHLETIFHAWWWH